MKKFYKIFLLLSVLIILSTYSSNKNDLLRENINIAFFNIQNIIVINNFLIKKKNIKEKLKNINNKNIFLIKRTDIEESLKEIDFLKKIEVKKKYPNTIVIKIFETKAVAILFKDKNKYLLDSQSNLIPFNNDERFHQLPGIFGNQAELNFINFLKKLELNKFPKKEIKNFYYFQIGRWDLQLINDKIIKFPYGATNKIIKKSIDLLNRNDFQKYNIIDLRVDGKIVVE